MRHIVFLLALAVWCASARAATVEGMVTNASTQTPVAGATVVLRKSVGFLWIDLGSATTGADGAYAIGSDHVGGAQLSASAAGLLPAQANVTLPQGSGAVAVNLALQPPGTISGSVLVASSGAPVAAQHVSLYAASTGSRYGFTDAQGRYTFDNLPGDSYRICVLDGTDGFVDLCWDDVVANHFDFPDNFTPVILQPGQVRDHIDLRREIPVALDAQGGYRIEGLAPGNYQLIARSMTPYYQAQLFSGIDCFGASCEFPLGDWVGIDASLSPRDDVHFSLQPGGSVTGSVRDGATGNPLAGLEVELYRVSTFIIPTVHLAASTRTDARGRYAFGQMQLVPHLIVVRGGNYISQRWPGVPCFSVCTDSIAQAVEVSLGDTLDLGAMNLDRGAWIEGRAHLPGQTDVPFRVNLYGQDGQSLGGVDVDSQGNYRFPAWLPGTYSVSLVAGELCVFYRDVPCTPPVVPTPLVLGAAGDVVRADFDVYVEQIMAAGFESD